MNDKSFKKNLINYRLNINKININDYSLSDYKEFRDKEINDAIILNDKLKIFFLINDQKLSLKIIFKNLIEYINKFNLNRENEILLDSNLKNLLNLDCEKITFIKFYELIINIL